MANRVQDSRGDSARRVGLWLVGASGGIGSTVALGLAALQRDLATTSGMVTCLPEFESLDLVQPQKIVFGGHEVRSEKLVDAVASMHRDASLFDANTLSACENDLEAYQCNIKPGSLYGSSAPVRDMADQYHALESCPAEAIERLAKDIAAFRTQHKLDNVIVIHTASAEPHPGSSPAHASYEKLAAEIAQPCSMVLPTSSLYALAALEAGCPYVNFTPSLGICVPAIQERAHALSLPYMGNDGKTGESLIKSFLAPMFALRNLRVMSWVGQNILGNRDGQVLADPATREAKIRSKDGLLNSLDGQETTRHVSIDYVPSLADWKVAWDFIHFEGFLGTKMSMQFTWQGSDSILAAPLIIDLARLADHAHRSGFVGAMDHLACFFKSPIGVNEHNYEKQWAMLQSYVAHAMHGNDDSNARLMSIREGIANGNGTGARSENVR
ncbi:MAG: inositol-3-phosphate synthase [Phycisphaerae bacterium]